MRIGRSYRLRIAQGDLGSGPPATSDGSKTSDVLRILGIRAPSVRINVLADSMLTFVVNVY